jgi:beta-galactosidase
LHYEGAIFHARNGETEVWRNGGRNATDVVCPMYPSIQSIVAYARSGADRPLVMCEYSHAMGNSNGSLADYWSAIENEPLLAGGFVWEWKDHGLRQTVDNTDRGKSRGRGGGKSADWRYAYGGQFGDTPNDGNFVADGVNAPDLTPHPVMRELAWVYRPVAVTAIGTTQFVVHNRQSHVGLRALHGTLSVLVAGAMVHEETVDIDVLALQQATCNFSSAAVAAINAAQPGDTITVQFRWTQRTETAYALAGHLVAWDEIEVRAPQSKNNFVDTGATTHQLPADSDFSAPIRLALMRATIDNDGYKVMPGFGEAHHIGGRALARWTRQGILADTIPTGVQHVQRREVQSDSSVVYHHRVTVPEPLAGLPRVGVRFALPPQFTHVRWFGRGPHENYPDRNASAMRDVWAREPDELPYIVPQEFGLRTDCEWIEFVAQDRTLRIDALSPATLHFSAVHHTPLQLFEALDVTQLERSKDLVVHLDVAHRGLGTASCGPDVDPCYEVAAGTYEFSYVVRRI